MKTLLSIIKSYLRDPKAVTRQWDALKTTKSGVGFACSRHIQPHFVDHDYHCDHATNPLANYFDHEDHNVIWKLRHYFDIYHRYLEKFRGKQTNILEVGIYGGGSLQMWLDYFGDQCQIIGIDINEECKQYESENISIHIGNQTDRNFWRKLKKSIPDIDVFIDDGGHRAVQQITSFEEILTKIRPGGVYICEDILGLDNHFLDYILGLIKALNACEHNEDNDYFEASYLQQKIKSIHVHPYILIIEMNESQILQFDTEKKGTNSSD